MTSIESWFQDALRRCAFLERYPLYTYIVSRFQPRDNPDIDVMAVSGEAGQPVLHINREYFADASEHLQGVLLHEIHHVVLGHLTDPRFRRPRFPAAMTIATEISANEDIREALPGAPIRLEQFGHLGIDTGQSTWERYEILIASQADPLSITTNMRCCSGQLSQRWAGAVDSRIVAELIGDANDARRDRSERIAGRTPGELLESLRDVDATSLTPLNWRDLLRHIAPKGCGRTHTYARPSRRFPARVGEVPGTSRRCQESRTRLLAVIDTSSSMKAAVVSDIFAELERLHAYADILVVECDATIQRVYSLARRPGDIKGRGGTDLRPPFERDFLARHRPAGVAYFTDGAGPYPDEPPGVPTLWVLTDTAPFGCPWGLQVRME